MDFYINLKVNFRGNSRNFLLSGSETKNWDSMEAMVKRSFGLCSLQLTYFDEENEEVSINSQGEYEEALKSAARQGNRLHMNVYEIRGQPARVPTTKTSGAEPKRGFRPPQHCPTLAQVVSRKVQAVVPEQAMVIMKEVKGTKEEDKTPPAWFTSYMEKFKDQVVREAVEKICREFSGQCCIHKPLGEGGVGGGAGGAERGRGEAVGGAEAQQVPEVSSSTLPGSPSSSTPPCSSCRGQTTGGGYQCRERRGTSRLRRLASGRDASDQAEGGHQGRRGEVCMRRQSSEEKSRDTVVDKQASRQTGRYGGTAMTEKTRVKQLRQVTNKNQSLLTTDVADTASWGRLAGRPGGDWHDELGLM